MEESDFVLYKNKDGAIESIGMPFENLFFLELLGNIEKFFY